MTRQKIRPEKESIVKEIHDRVKDAAFVILADGSGLNVELTAELRGQLRDVDASMQVVKNRLLGVAARDLGWPDMASLLQGPTTMVVGDGDVTRVAKQLKTFRAARRLPVMKGGVMGGRALTAEDVEALAAVPPREVLLGQVVGTIAAPMTRLVGLMGQKLSSLLYALRAVAEKKAASTGE